MLGPLFWSGRGKFEGKLSKNTVFLGTLHDNKLGKFANVIQDKFDHDKGQKSAISGAVSTAGSPLDFLLFLQYLCAI